MLRPKRTKQFCDSISDKYFEFLVEEHGRNIVSDERVLDILMIFDNIAVDEKTFCI